MSISEAQRFEMHLGLRNTLGDVVANSLMEHLPPSGWSDVARTNDIDRVEARLTDRFDRADERMDRMDKRIDGLEAEMRDGFKSVRNTMRFIVGLTLTGAGGIVVLLIQLNQSISALK